MGSWGKGRLEEETLSWLFVGNTPILFKKKNAVRQSQVETWLDLAQIVKELGIEKPTKKQSANQTSYVV